MSTLTNVIPVLFVSVPNKFYGKFRSFSKERNHVSKKEKKNGAYIVPQNDRSIKIHEVQIFVTFLYELSE